MKLDKLKQLAEGKAPHGAKSLKFVDGLQEKMEKAYDIVKDLSLQFESSVLTDILKNEGFPATESKAAKVALAAALKAASAALREIEDLHQAIGTHFQEQDELNEAEESRERFTDFSAWKKAAKARGMDKADEEFLSQDTAEMRHGSVNINLALKGKIVSKWNPHTQQGWVSSK